MEVMRKLYPDVEVQNKDITGKNSFGFQEKYGVYFLNGEDDAKTRELTRKILEEDIFNITLENDEVITLNGKEEVLLVDGSKKIVKNLTEHDEIDGNLKIKKIEERHSILIANYALLSTGVNLRKLHSLLLSSPLKSYTTVTQSIGRGMRLHKTKDVFTVFDLVDDFGFRSRGGIFYKQYQHRKQTSYNVEEFPVHEREFALY
jgi:hypothetical protein